jgi:hypothetical protein
MVTGNNSAFGVNPVIRYSRAKPPGIINHVDTMVDRRTAERR